MPRLCTICGHEARRKIEAAIVSGTAIRGIARTFRVSEDALSRHRQHVSQAIVKASEKREESIGQSILSRLEALYGRAERILDDAEREGDGRLALAANRELRETLGGIFALVSKAAEARGDVTEWRIRHIFLGQPQTHEWEELPESWSAFLPGKPKGQLYIVREHAPESNDALA